MHCNPADERELGKMELAEWKHRSSQRVAEADTSVHVNHNHPTMRGSDAPHAR
jgi:hypothetical protein